MVEASVVTQLSWYGWWLIAGGITTIFACFKLFWFQNWWSGLYIVPLSIALWPLVIIIWYSLYRTK